MSRASDASWPDKRALTIGQRLDRWMVNEGERRIFVFVLMLLHFMVFIFAMISFLLKDSLTMARATFGITFPIARASALVLHFDVILILLPVCRNLISYLRNTSLGTIIPFDRNITFHKFIAWSIVLFSWIHTIAHWNNFAQLARTAKLGFKGWLLANFTTGPGISGYLMLVILMLMLATAIEKPRRRNFERFWYTHHLFVLFFLLWQFHGAYCMITPDRAPFCKGTAVFYRYWAFGAFIYLAERILREVRGRYATFISKVIQHPSRVCEIQIKKEYYNVKAGQYIFLCCPEISLHQYHPFTLTSAPEEDYISIHMRCVGDFTNALAKSLGCDFDRKEEKNPFLRNGRDRQSRIVTDGETDLAVQRLLPKIIIDGPFGSASEDVFKFEAVMLIGAGIGVTPFASILKSIWYRINYPQTKQRLGKVYFFWICRDYASFEWFRSLLLAIEGQDVGHLIEIHTYLTAKIQPDDAQNIMINGADSDVDAVTGLRSPVNYGRPQWDQIFAGVAGLHPATDVGVFFCGPSALGSTLHVKSNEYSSAGSEGTRFVFGKETF